MAIDPTSPKPAPSVADIRSESERVLPSTIGDESAEESSAMSELEAELVLRSDALNAEILSTFVLSPIDAEIFTSYGPDPSYTPSGGVFMSEEVSGESVSSGDTPEVYVPPAGAFTIPADPDIFFGEPSYVIERDNVNFPRVSKKTMYIDTNLLENSNDKLRNSLKAFYALKENEDGSSAYVFQNLPYFSKAGMGLRHITKFAATGTNVFNFIALYARPSKINDLAVTSLSIPVLLGTGKDFTNDEHWRKYVNGGTFNGIKYAGLNMSGFGEQQVFVCDMPFELQSLKENHKNVELENYDFITLKSHTNYSLPRYERYTKTITAKLLPNFYSMVKHNRWCTGDGHTPKEVGTDKFYNLNNIYQSRELQKPVVTNYPPPEDFRSGDVLPVDLVLTTNKYIDRNVSVKKYLNTMMEQTYPSELLQTIEQNNSTILFPYGINERTNELKKYVPYYNSIKIPIRNEYFAEGVWPDYGDGKLALKNIFNQIFNNDYSIILSNLLKKNFVDNRQGNTEKEKNFAVNQRILKDGELSMQTTSATLRYVDLFEMLTEEVNSVLSDSADSIIGPDSHGVESASEYASLYMNSKAVNSAEPSYRYNKKISSLRKLDQIFKLSKESLWSFQINPFPVHGSDEYESYYPDNFFNDAGTPRYSETIGYRIRKTTPQVLNSDRRPIDFQDVIILKNTATRQAQTEYEFIDTQIKKGIEYNYQIFEYKIVLGHKYTFKNTKVTRKLAEELETIKDADTGGYSAVGTAYCVEFYDPTSFDVAASSFKTLPLAKLEESKYMGDAQIISKFPFLAEMTLNIEPAWRIYEVPIVSKEIVNTDHPAPPLEVNGYQRKDDSQIIGFHLLKEHFALHDLPVGLNDEENKVLEQYFNSQNLINTDQMVSDTKSKIKEIEIFRIDKKPTSIKDFNNKLVTTKSLLMTDSEYDVPAVFTDCFYEEKIKTNTKLYYTFRAINDEGVKGSFSPIFETELIDDGNYKYAVFNKIELSELKPEKIHTEPSKNFKKLLQLIPTPEQLALNDKNVDYSQEAESQLNNVIVGKNVNSIWDKKFKVRMTSKKTGKKIDLNITYKLRT